MNGKKYIYNHEQANFDLAVIANRYSEYLTSLNKRESITAGECRSDISSALTDNAVFENIINSSNSNKVSELDDLENWV